ncbi:MAG: ABC transporter substrate-binding protein [Thermoproteus sp.]
MHKVYTTLLLVLGLLAINLYAQTTTTTTAISLPRNETLYAGGAMWYTPTNWNPLAQLWASGAAYGVFGYVYWPLFFWNPYQGLLLPALGKWYGWQFSSYSANVPIQISVSGGSATITVNATNVQVYTTQINLANVPTVSWPSYIYIGNIKGGSPQFIGITTRGNVTITVVNITAVVGSTSTKTVTVSASNPVFFNVTVVYPTQLQVSNEYTLLAYYAPGDVFKITPVPRTGLPVFTAPFNVTASKFIVMNLTGVTQTTLPVALSFDRAFLVVTLWPGEYWQDGQPITSKDVAFSFYYELQHPELGNSWIWGPSSYGGNLISVLPYNTTTAIFVFNGTPNMDNWLATQLRYYPILPQHIWYNVSTPLTWTNPNPVGSGPYKAFYLGQTEVVFVKWDDWWGWKVFGLNPAYPPKYLVQLYVTSNALVPTMIQQHMLDWNSFFVPNIQTFTKYRMYTYLPNPPYFLQYPSVMLMIANNTYPWNICAVRRAVAMVINATPLSQVAEFGYELPCKDPLCITGTVFENSWAPYINWTAVQQYGWSYNPQKAAQILQSLGFYKGSDGYWRTPNGTILSLTIAVPYGWTDWMQMAQMLADQLSAFGIKAEMAAPQFSAWWTNVQQGTFSAVIMWSWTGFTPFPYFQEVMYPTGTNGAPVPPGQATWGDYERFYKSGIYDIFLKIMATPITDYQTLQKYYTELIKAYFECAPAIPLLSGAYWYAYDTTYWTGWPNASNPAPVFVPAWSPPDDILVVLHLKPASLAVSTVTTTYSTTVTTTYSTTVISGTTTTVPVTVTTSVPVTSVVTSAATTTVSAVPSWVWGVVGLLIVVIIVVAVLALRRR